MIYHKHHIVPRYAGGTDDPSNLVLLSVEEHAEAHKQLYEQYGRIEDKIAWLGLAKMISKQEHIIEQTRMAGMKTLEMKVGIHDPQKIHLKQEGGRQSMKRLKLFSSKSKWMNNGTGDTRILIEEVELKKSMGWKMGRLFSVNRGRKNLTLNLFWVNKNGKNKRIKKEQMSEYEKSGWSPGMYMKEKACRKK